MGQLSTIVVIIVMGVLAGTNISAFSQADVCGSSLDERFDPEPGRALLDRSAIPSSLTKNYLHELIRQAQLELDKLPVPERFGEQINYPIVVPNIKSSKEESAKRNLAYKKSQEYYAKNSHSLPVDDPGVMDSFSKAKHNILNALSKACNGTSTSLFEVSPLISASKHNRRSVYEIFFTVIQKEYDQAWQCRAYISHKFLHMNPPILVAELSPLDCHIFGGPKFTAWGYLKSIQIMIPDE